jgi:hypothetical protein
MKEIDIKNIILNNFWNRMMNIRYKEYPTMYDALHSSEYRKVSQRNFDAICDRFEIAKLEFDYISQTGLIPMEISFNIGFDFEYAKYEKLRKYSKRAYGSGERFSVKPVLGINEIQIELGEMSKVNREVYKLLWDNIPSGGGEHGGVFQYYCIAGMQCEGHPFWLSKVKLPERIINFFNYLFGIVDQAIDYQEHPEKKSKIVHVEQSSYYENEFDEYERDCFDNL